LSRDWSQPNATRKDGGKGHISDLVALAKDTAVDEEETPVEWDKLIAANCTALKEINLSLN
jgi:hypothetical protein